MYDFVSLLAVEPINKSMQLMGRNEVQLWEVYYCLSNRDALLSESKSDKKWGNTAGRFYTVAMVLATTKFEEILMTSIDNHFNHIKIYLQMVKMVNFDYYYFDSYLILDGRCIVYKKEVNKIS